MKRTSKINEALLLGAILLFVLVFVGNTIVGDAKAQECVQPPVGMVSWWPGDGNANDIQDGNNGMLMNGATFSPGLVSQAFSFDGLDDFVAILSKNGLSPTTEVSVDAWIKTNGTVNRRMVIYDRLETRDGFGLLLDDSGFPGFSINGGLGLVISSIDVDDGQWHHLAGTYSQVAGEVRIYVDGTLRGTASHSLPIDYDPEPRNQIGTANNSFGDTFFFEGIADEIEVFNRALSISEIQAIFNAGSAGKCKDANRLTISPPSGDYVTTQGFDLTLIVEAPGLSVVGGSAILDGSDVTSSLAACVIPGTLVLDGHTFRCPGLTGNFLGTGTHILVVTLDLSDGSSVSDSVNWEVKENTEP